MPIEDIVKYYIFDYLEFDDITNIFQLNKKCANLRLDNSVMSRWIASVNPNTILKLANVQNYYCRLSINCSNIDAIADKLHLCVEMKVHNRTFCPPPDMFSKMPNLAVFSMRGMHEVLITELANSSNIHDLEINCAGEKYHIYISEITKLLPKLARLKLINYSNDKNIIIDATHPLQKLTIETRGDIIIDSASLQMLNITHHSGSLIFSDKFSNLRVEKLIMSGVDCDQCIKLPMELKLLTYRDTKIKFIITNLNVFSGDNINNISIDSVLNRISKASLFDDDELHMLLVSMPNIIDLKYNITEQFNFGRLKKLRHLQLSNYFAPKFECIKHTNLLSLSINIHEFPGDFQFSKSLVKLRINTPRVYKFSIDADKLDLPQLEYLEILDISNSLEKNAFIKLPSLKDLRITTRSPNNFMFYNLPKLANLEITLLPGGLPIGLDLSKIKADRLTLYGKGLTVEFNDARFKKFRMTYGVVVGDRPDYKFTSVLFKEKI